ACRFSRGDGLSCGGQCLPGIGERASEKSGDLRSIMLTALNWDGQASDSKLICQFFQLRPRCLINFHAVFELSCFVCPRMFARQQDLLESGRWLGGFYKCNKLVDFV